jgi:hypothetical protein
LLRLGVQLDHIGEEWLAKQLSDASRRAAWEEACIKAGLPRLAHGSVSDEEWHERNDKRQMIYNGDEDEVDEYGASVAWPPPRTKVRRGIVWSLNLCVHIWA